MIFSGSTSARRPTTDRLSAPGTRICVLSALFLVLFLALAQNFASLRAFDAWSDSFGKPILRDSYLVMSNLMRLEREIQQVFPSDSVGFDQASRSTGDWNRLKMELDLLWIRKEEFARLDIPEQVAAETEVAVEALKQYVETVEALLDAPEDVAILKPRARIHADELRRAFLSVVEEWRTASVVAINEKRNRLNNSVWLSNLFAVLSGLSALAAFHFLVREVGARKAKQAAEEDARHLAYNDSLTGIPNRFSFNQELAGWLHRYHTDDAGFSVALIDLDRFKEINDTLGHEVGDAVLYAQAERIARLVASRGGFAARLSGDEFAALLPLDEAPDLEAFCAEMVAALGQPVETKLERVGTAGSVGMCAVQFIEVDAAVMGSELTRAADFALYDAKQSVETRWRIFDAALRSQMANRRALVAALPSAIAEQEIIPFFQPKVDIATGRPVSFEALARWRRDGRIIPPADFIDIAEEAGMVDEIDLLVMRQAAQEIAALNARTLRDISFSSNLSAKHFKSLDVVSDVRTILETTGLRPDLLMLEITETSQLEDWTRVDMTIQALRRLGCGISIDDFGTGYSSLSYLRTIQADEVKIDRTFVDNLEGSMEAQFLLDAIIDIACGLNMRVVVEGVETTEQARLIHRMGCNIAQGYLYSVPVPAHELDAMVARPFLGPDKVIRPVPYADRA